MQRYELLAVDLCSTAAFWKVPLHTDDVARQRCSSLGGSERTPATTYL
jgi:hypothetical protein